jgi:hypothetical protein
VLHPSPLKEISSWDLSKGIMRGEVQIFTLMEETPGNWIVGNLHIPTWLHPPNDHSTELYKIRWSSFGWSNLVVPISWPDNTCTSSRAREHIVNSQQLRKWLHLIGQGSILFNDGVHRCSEELAFPLCWSDVHVSLEKHKCIRDHWLQTLRDDIFCWCNSFDGTRLSRYWNDFASPSPLLMS